LVVGWGFRLSLDYSLGGQGLHTQTAAAHNPCVSWDFVFYIVTISDVVPRDTTSSRGSLEAEFSLPWPRLGLDP